MRLHAQLQGFQSLQKQKSVERAERRAEIAQAFDASLHDIRHVAEGFIEAYAVVTLAWLQKLREAALIPGKTAAVDDHAANRGAMAANEFRGGVDHDIGAVLDRTAQIGRGEGVVNDQRKIILVRHSRHRGDIEHVNSRVADGFAVDRAGARGDRAAKIISVFRIDKRGLNTEAAEAHVELRVRAAIERLGRDDLIARFEKAHQGDKL